MAMASADAARGALVVAGLFWLGRALSLAVYASTWLAQNGFVASMLGGADAVRALRGELKRTRSLLLRFLLDRPWWWPLHVAVLVALSGAAPGGVWRADLWGVRVVACVHCALMCVGKALLRIGHVELGNFFLLDRALCVAMCACGWVWPAAVYVATVQACCLTYTVGCSAGLSQPYSNYLGFEYCRWTTCMSLAVASAAGAGGWLAAAGWPGWELDAGHALLVVLAAVAAYYWAQGAGKLRLGRHWLQWPLRNRIECLFVNSFLRGHLASWVSVDGAVAVARAMRAVRVPLNVGGLVVELAAIASVVSPGAACAAAALRAAFHGGVVVMTGLFDWEAMVGNTVLAAAVASGGFDAAFGGAEAGASASATTAAAATAAACVVLSDQWAVWVASLPDLATKIVLFDAADLPMCWWDSHYMRMFEWSVETEARLGVELAFPVHLFCPFDTLITDIHTRLMNLQLYPGLDRVKSQDRRVIKSGVWGLLLDRHDAELVHGLADEGATEDELRRQFCPALHDATDPWHVDASAAAVAAAASAVPGKNGKGSASRRDDDDDDDDGIDDIVECEAVADLVRFFRGWNRHVRMPWFRALGDAMGGCYHWPGEDLVPDVSPLRSPPRQRYSADDGPVSAVRVRRVKTWFSGEGVVVLEDTLVGVIRLAAPPPATAGQGGGAVRGGPAPGPRRVSSRDVGRLTASEG